MPKDVRENMKNEINRRYKKKESNETNYKK